MVVVLGFGFVHGGERDVEKERGEGGRKRDNNLREERYCFGLYILLCRYLYYYLRGSLVCIPHFFGSKIPIHSYVYVETKLKDNLVKIQL